MKKQIERILFIVAFLVCVLSLFIESNILNAILIISSIAYLFLGWYLLNPNDGKKFDFVFFIIGYSYATLFVTAFLNIVEWPLLKEFQISAICFLILSGILLISIERIRIKGIIENLTKTILLLAWVIIDILK